MRKTVEDYWLNPNMVAINNYERAITLMSGDNKYQRKEEDIERIMEPITNYSDFKIENIYQIIYEHQPLNFIKVMNI